MPYCSHIELPSPASVQIPVGNLGAQMLRQLLVASAVGVLGLFGAVGVSTAAPAGATSYPPPPAETTTSATSIVLTTPSIVVTNPSTNTSSRTTPTTFATESVSVSGGGMLPGEQVSVTVEYSGPSGLRANAALRAATVKAAGTMVIADANGNFSAGVTIDKGRTGTIVATGLTSGHTVSFALSANGGVGGGTGGGSTPTTNVAPTTNVDASGQTTTAPSATGSAAAIVADAPADEASSAGLAYTGASIAGPLTVGAGALLLGVAMLFFGTRLAIRRKSSPRQRTF